jgi:hypothetical protein
MAILIGKWVLAVVSVLNYCNGYYDVATYQMVAAIFLELSLKD